MDSIISRSGIDEAKKTLARLKASNWNAGKRMWMVDGRPASTKETEEFQRKVRELKFINQIYADQEALINPKTPIQVKMAIHTLNQRRTNPDLWGLIGKKKADGEHFMFREPTIKTVCGCTDEQHKESVCPSPIEITERLSTHTIGNRACQACALVENENIIEGSDGVEKSLRLCPRYLASLRMISMSNYLTMVNASETHPKCFAGLIHIEMEMAEGVQDGNFIYIKDKQYHLPLANSVYVLGSFSRERVTGNEQPVNTVIFRCKCDTCSYGDEYLQIANYPKAAQPGEEYIID